MDANEIKKLLSEGHTDEAIDQLIIYGKSQSTISNIISNISAEFHRLKDSYIAGVISEDEYSKGINKINFRILSLIDQKKNVASVNLIKSVNPIIYFIFLVIVVAIGGFMIYQHYNKDPLANNKIAVYNEALNVVAGLSSSSKLSEEYLDHKIELDDLINVKSEILRDSIFRQMLVVYYYYLEQYERDSEEVDRPTIQKKSNEIAQYGVLKIKNLQK